MKIKRITKPEQINSSNNVLYFETQQNSRPNNILVKDCSLVWKMYGSPIKDKDIYPSAPGYLWVMASLIWGDKIESKKPEFHSIADMGVTDEPHNNHKLYCIEEGSYERVKVLSLEQLEKLTEEKQLTKGEDLSKMKTRNDHLSFFLENTTTGAAFVWLGKEVRVIKCEKMHQCPTNLYTYVFYLNDKNVVRFEDMEEVQEAPSFLELHRMVWIKLYETGGHDKEQVCRDIIKDFETKGVYIKMPHNICFLCEETKGQAAFVPSCNNCKGYWGFGAKKCTEASSYYQIWCHESDISLRKALALRIANNLKGDLLPTPQKKASIEC